MVASRTIPVLAILACLPAAAPPGPARAEGPAGLLRELRDRDSAFDGRAIEVEERWVERISPRMQDAARRFHARLAHRVQSTPIAETFPEDYDQPHRLRQRLVVREPAVTIERLDDLEPMKHPAYSSLPNRGCRWSSAGGIERVWSPETKTLHIDGPSSDAGSLRWEAHRIRWGCGHGFARWITSIDSEAEEYGMRTVKGRMRLLGHDDSRVTLVLDRDLIVRHAVVTIPVRNGPGSDRYLVDSRGTVRPEGAPPVAESARFRRIVTPASGRGDVLEDREIRFVSASARLSDAEYDRLTRIDPSSATTVVRAPE
ncbi:hypothetical protein OJF2_63040 [Aquisphaera giovannonii]|uniref:Uncharacterized protein n=1 Tax=Aquisphaera giovannonii TaxID=406548 RepID=A0A5B9WB12_9BACT|nr:hypothetical protein [Aquisphaera giovannonii]QEH37713.1 hypothetical protein OJF2_63040 [Aquisphaera giovannonii]